MLTPSSSSDSSSLSVSESLLSSLSGFRRESTCAQQLTDTENVLPVHSMVIVIDFRLMLALIFVKPGGPNKHRIGVGVKHSDISRNGHTLDGDRQSFIDSK